MVESRPILIRRIAATALDLGIESLAGVLGTYFGMMASALSVAMEYGDETLMHRSLLKGAIAGFTVFSITVSLLNRVFIQSASRASVGKQFFELQLVAMQGELSRMLLLKRWAYTAFSFLTGGLGYTYLFFNSESRAFHDLFAGTTVRRAKRSVIYVEHQDEEGKVVRLPPGQSLPRKNAA